jgi:excinuclease ABC subunit B
MSAAISETNRRRAIQQAYNEANGIIPKTIVKGVRDVIDISAGENDTGKRGRGKGKKGTDVSDKTGKLSAKEREELIERMTREMKAAARALEFEKAAWIRDEIARIKAEK